MSTTVDLNRPRVTVWRVFKVYCFVVGFVTTVLAAHLTIAKLYDGTWQKVSPHVGFLGAEVVQMAGNTVLFEPIETAAVNPAKDSRPPLFDPCKNKAPAGQEEIRLRECEEQLKSSVGKRS
jgi:hypothetical protein